MVPPHGGGSPHDELALAAQYVCEGVDRVVPERLAVGVAHEAEGVRSVLEEVLGVDDRHVEARVQVEQLVQHHHAARPAAKDDHALRLTAQCDAPLERRAASPCEHLRPHLLQGGRQPRMDTHSLRSERLCHLRWRLACGRSRQGGVARDEGGHVVGSGQRRAHVLCSEGVGQRQHAAREERVLLHLRRRLPRSCTCADDAGHRVPPQRSGGDVIPQHGVQLEGVCVESRAARHHLACRHGVSRGGRGGGVLSLVRAGLAACLVRGEQHRVAGCLALDELLLLAPHGRLRVGQQEGEGACSEQRAELARLRLVLVLVVLVRLPDLRAHLIERGGGPDEGEATVDRRPALGLRRLHHADQPLLLPGRPRRAGAA
mmetsp:Transcript_77167/g.186492  ORF Transcript_77167/g.186492 Transcript_77167/m.186492 type:complete len:373 (+) Transcript_77167:773-1891(+)